MSAPPVPGPRKRKDLFADLEPPPALLPEEPQGLLPESAASDLLAGGLASGESGGDVTGPYDTSSRAPAALARPEDLPPDPRIADASASLAIPRRSIWDRLGQAGRVITDNLFGLPPQAAGGLSGEERSYAISQGLMQLGAKIAGGDPTQSIFGAVAQALPVGRQAAMQAIGGYDAYQERKRQAAFRVEREKILNEFKSGPANLETLTRLQQRMTTLAGLGDKEAAATAGPLSNTIQALASQQFIKTNPQQVVFKPTQKPDGSWTLEKVGENTNLTAQAQRPVTMRLYNKEDGRLHQYSWDPVSKKYTDHGLSTMSGVELSMLRGNKDETDAATYGVPLRLSINEIRPYWGDKDTMGQATKALNAIVGANASKVLGMGELMEVATRNMSANNISPEAQLVVNNMFNIMALITKKEAGLSQTVSEWVNQTRRFMPLINESDKALADKLTRMDREWMLSRNRAGQYVWERMSRGVYSDEDRAADADFFRSTGQGGGFGGYKPEESPYGGPSKAPAGAAAATGGGGGGGQGGGQKKKTSSTTDDDLSWGSPH